MIENGIHEHVKRVGPPTTDPIVSYAARCRATCPRMSQEHTDSPCGTEHYDGSIPYWTFCGRHWTALVGGDEID